MTLNETVLRIGVTVVLLVVAPLGCRRLASPIAPLADTLAIVERGVISTDAPEFALALSADGREIYFNRASADRSTLSIMVSARVDGRWSSPVVATFSGQYRDIDPFITADGQRLYFTSDRPRGTPPARSYSTWYVDRTPSGWSAPIDPGPPVNSDSADMYVSVTHDGTLVFSSTRDGARRVYETTMVAGRWTPPRALAGSPAENIVPFMSPSGRFMLFTLQVPSRQADLFFSCREGAGWSAPRPLAPLVNSAYADFAPSIDAGEQTLFFTSERPGIVGAQPDSIRPPGDLYRISLASAGVRCQ